MLDTGWLRCPICDEPLARAAGTLRCPRDHSFDIAREGYVNLLVGRGRVRPEQAGDTKEMVAARRRVLPRGFYDLLSDRINDLAGHHLRNTRATTPRVLDVGCGEGFYLGRLRQALLASGRYSEAFCRGIDLSKEAIRAAARRYPDNAFVVADVNQRLPVATASCDIVLDIFAPRNPGEFRRVIASDGVLLVVIPGPDHLRELRETLRLLTIEEEKERRVVERFAGVFTPVERLALDYHVALDRSGLQDLVMMTPNYWHLSPETRAALHHMDGLQTRLQFRLLLFRPLAPEQRLTKGRSGTSGASAIM